MNDFTGKKVAIYGGSFNPIHIGHLLTGFTVIENLGYDYIMYIPDNIPSHKDFQDAVNCIHRLKMVKLAIKGINNFLCSDLEIKRGGISYTIDTIKELKNKYNYSDKFGIIIGDDLLSSLNNWKEIDLLNEISDIICLYRNNNKEIKTKYNIKLVKNRIIQVSSTEIRTRINNGLNIDFMVPNNIKKYIKNHKLYGFKNG
jgi:nicotinate-nucleotide adenylyltransferase